MTKTKALTGIPLQCRLLAEAFDEELKIFYQSLDLATVISFEIIFWVNRAFCEGKYDIYPREYSQFTLNNLPVK